MSNNFANNNTTNLINNLINTNNEIKNNIITLLNVNTSNRQNNNYNRHNNRHYYHNNNNRQAYINNPTISNLFRTFFDPIQIFPTPSQIETATRVVRFSDIINPLNSSCPISLENFNDNDQVLIIRHCNHVFSNTGLTSWFRSSCVCPICRYDIRNYVSTNTNNISDLSANVDLSSNILSSSIPVVERNTSSNELVDLFFTNLLNNTSDTSSNNLSSNSLLSNFNRPQTIYVTNDGIEETYATDISGNNILRFFYSS